MSDNPIQRLLAEGGTIAFGRGNAIANEDGTARWEPTEDPRLRVVASIDTPLGIFGSQTIVDSPLDEALWVAAAKVAHMALRGRSEALALR